MKYLFNNKINSSPNLISNTNNTNNYNNNNNKKGSSGFKPFSGKGTRVG